jgi:two-component system chemotaxis response regulator CheY
MRKKLKNFLEENYSDIEVMVAENGKEAVGVYSEERPNLVFLDIVMPVLDGIGALKLIREFDSSAKVVITSSSGTKQKLKEALESGAIEFIQKPWSPERIKFIVDKFKAEGE